MISHVVVLLLGNQHLRTLLSDLFLPLESLAAAALLLLVALRERAAGRRAFAAWLLLAFALLCVAESNLQWSVFEVLQGISPFPIVGDLVYLLSYPTFLVGAFLLSPPSARPGEKLRQRLDIGIIGLSAMLVLWIFLLGPVLVESPWQPPLQRGMGVTYLVGDLALVSTLIVLVFGRAGAVFAATRWLLTGSIVARMAADSLFGFQLLGGVSANGNMSDAAYAASSLSAFCAALLQMSRPSPVRKETPKSLRVAGLQHLVDWRTHLPFLGILAAFFIFLWGRAHPLPVADAALAAWTGIIIILSIVRQALQGVENARLNRDLDRRVQQRTIGLTEANLELFLLNKVRAAIAKELDLSIVLKTIVETVAETLGYSMVSLYLREADELVLQHEVGYERKISRISVSQGIIGRVVRTGQPAVVGDASWAPDFLVAVPGVASGIAVPLQDHGAVEGVLSVESMRDRAFGDSDLRMLREVADHAMTAIMRGRYFALLREYQQELQRRVDERTSALRDSQERLRQAEKMEAIGRLAGGVAHDFNNMLTVIMGHGQMLLEAGDLPPERRREVAAMLESAERAAALTHQLLTFSRQQVIDVQSLDLNAVIDGMSDMVARLVGEHVRLEIRHGQDLWHVLSDRVQMEQVLLNLSANAADAMKSGGVIEIETGNVSAAAPLPLPMVLVPAGSYVLLTVRDTGEGMPVEVQEHVFEPFFTTKGKGKGTGLGLATVYGIIRQAKGFIALESEPGKGATFRIYLPAHEPQLVGDAHERGPEMPPGGTESILVVDDQDEVRGIMVMMLQALGYSVNAAANGKEALDLLNSLPSQPDLVITDVAMPDMTGPALVRQIAELGLAPKTLFMSGYASDAFEKGSTEAFFLQKPFTATVLGAAVRRALDG